ncbi:MAG: YjjG family noncanonical pyrimidine nucleotidase [Lachnospiraceae bacterium]
MSKIKVILWDIDGTLLNFEEAEKYAIEKCFFVFGLGECTDSMLAAYSKINRRYWQRLERGEISKQQVLEGRFREFFAEYGIDTSVACAFNEEYQKRLGDTVVFYPNGLETVQACRGKILQYAVTNGTRAAQERKLENSGLNRLLDGVFISDIIGIEKPMKGFFEQVFNAIGDYSGSEVMIVGDSLTSDIQGGNNAGILTCWFNPEKKENSSSLRIDYEIQDLGQVLEILHKSE